MEVDVLYCPVCDGIELSWNKYTNKWIAPYADGGSYCTCSDEERSRRLGTYIAVPELTIRPSRWLRWLRRG